MLDHLLRQLRLVCRLLAALDRNGGPNAPEPAKWAKTYGLPRQVTYQVTVTVQPIFPDYLEGWSVDTLRAKTSRRRVARAVAREVDELLVGYKVGVQVEIRRG